MKAPLQITVEFTTVTDPISGRLQGGDKSGRLFAGWLGLMTAVQDALAEAAAGDKEIPTEVLDA